MENVFDFSKETTEAQYVEQNLKATRQLMANLDSELQKLKCLDGSRERSLAISRLQEAILWLGLDFKKFNERNLHYNIKIDSPIDGMKM